MNILLRIFRINHKSGFTIIRTSLPRSLLSLELLMYTQSFLLYGQNVDNRSQDSLGKRND